MPALATVSEKINFDSRPQMRWKNTLILFKQMAQRVPAYKHFLKKEKINYKRIKTKADLEQIPIINKKNYLQNYSHKSLCWNGSLKKMMIFTSTSGSTGRRYYFPRTTKKDEEYTSIIKSFLDRSSYGHKEPMLVVDAFSMGIWIGGLITYKAFELAGINNDKYSLSLVTPGINKQQIISIFRTLSPSYSQTIIAGYPPFIKDVIDTAVRSGINLKKLHIRTLFAAEGFSDQFREYIVNEASIKNIYRDTMNIYGSADMGAMAYETPLSILIRNLSLHNSDLFKLLFPKTNKTPTFVQFNPLHINFETKNGALLLSGDNAIPLVRYSIGDQGGVFDFSEIISLCEYVGIDIFDKIKKLHLNNTIQKFPFVYLYERDDFAATVYGLQIYPEHIRSALLDAYLQKFITGKFAMETKFNSKQNQYLEINVELKPGSKIDLKLKKRVINKIIQELYKKNSEFKELHTYLKNRAVPRLKFYKYQHPRFFLPDIKQKWVIDSQK